MEICASVDSLSWAPHPIAEGVEIKPLVTKKNDGLDVTCVLVKIPAGIEIPGHIHETQAEPLNHPNPKPRRNLNEKFRN